MTKENSYKTRKTQRQDETSIVAELKAISQVLAVSIYNRTSTNVVRGGNEIDERIKIISFLIKNKKITALINAIAHVNHKQKQAKPIQK